jgi:hypothetical protein
VQAFCQTAGSTSRGKLVILCLDDAQAVSQNALLKLLEEPPFRVKFLLTASQPPLPTVVSRAFVQRCGLLSTDEVVQVLAMHGIVGQEARSAALLAGGRVSVALADDAAGEVLERVRAALKATSAKDPAALARAFRNGMSGAGWQQSWMDAHHLLLSQWATEAAICRWRLFCDQDAPALSLKDARYVLTMLTSLEGARPGLLDRAVLEKLVARGDNT